MIFRRKKASDETPDDRVDDVVEPLEAAEDPRAERPRGPWDAGEREVPPDSGTHIDLGGLVVEGRPDIELRLQVDEQTGAVTSIMLAGPGSGLELRAFAAPRSTGIWDDVRKDIAAEATRHGGTATEQDGEFGTELLVVVPVQTPDGRSGTQTSRIVGVEGPRWLLRGTFLGTSAVDPDPEGVVESAFRDVIVVRGSAPMAPRDQIPMQVPAQAERVVDEAADEAEGEADDDAVVMVDPDDD